MTQADDSQVHLTFANMKDDRPVVGRRICFSAYRCFRLDGSDEEHHLLERLGRFLLEQEGLALFGRGALVDALLAATPGLAAHVLWHVRDLDESHRLLAQGIPDGVRVFFLAEPQAFLRMQFTYALPEGIRVIEADVLLDLAWDAIPRRAWVPMVHHIYPLQVPGIQFREGLDLLVVDGPARNMALMPNGLGYLNNALKKAEIRHQIFDLDVVLYHRFHIHRLLDLGGTVHLANGKALPEDPWQADQYDLWTGELLVDHFNDCIQEVAAKIVQARPKVLGFSVHECNERFTRRLFNAVKERWPDVTVVVGGYNCYLPQIGLRAFAGADYVCIGEADLTIAPLIQALARGERPKNSPGIVSRFDDPGTPFIPAPMAHDLDGLGRPDYDWVDLEFYRNFNGYQLTPVIASRGCRWSRCTFCAERFFWRIRSAHNFVDELEWMFRQGCTLFMFNESDLNGLPERLLAICNEIIRRGLRVRLTGQLRIHKNNDRAFFDTLRAAGVVALRFGIDAFTPNTLKLQKKGYTVKHIRQNLKDCHEAGIFTEINWVIGVPGETDDDVEQGIRLIRELKPFIGRVGNINPLILAHGSVYWQEPEKHGIRFRGEKQQLMDEHYRALPAESWYSIDPFIDTGIRQARYERIVISLHEAGFDMGAMAELFYRKVRAGADSRRAAGGNTRHGKKEEQRESRSVVDVPLPVGPLDEPPSPEPAAPDIAHILRHAGSCYALTRQAVDSHPPPGMMAGLRRWFGKNHGKTTARRIAAWGGLIRVVGIHAAPEEQCVLEQHNVIRFDGLYYAVPFGLMVDWQRQDPAALPGVLWDRNIKRLLERIRKQAAASVAQAPATVVVTQSPAEPPRLLGARDGYNLVQFRQEVLGVPQSAGPMEIDRVALDTIPGLIRGRSRQEVETAIGSLSHGNTAPMASPSRFWRFFS